MQEGRYSGLAWLLVTTLLVWATHARGASVRVGHPFPKLQLQNARGQTVPLTFPATGLVVIQVWATWCAPCHQLLPLLLQATKDIGPSRLHLVLWNIDDQRARAWSYLQQQGPLADQAEVFFDPGGRTFAQLGAPGMPVVFVVDSGVVREIFTGFSEEVRQRLLARMRGAAEATDTAPPTTP